MFPFKVNTGNRNAPIFSPKYSLYLLHWNNNPLIYKPPESPLRSAKCWIWGRDTNVNLPTRSHIDRKMNVCNPIFSQCFPVCRYCSNVFRYVVQITISCGSELSTWRPYRMWRNARYPIGSVKLESLSKHALLILQLAFYKLVQVIAVDVFPKIWVKKDEKMFSHPLFK